MDKIQIINALEQEKDELQRRLDSLEMTILTLKQSFMSPQTQRVGDAPGSKTINSAPRYAGYHEAKSNKKKAIIIIKEAGKFLHMRQIKEIAQSLEPRESSEDIVKGIAQAVYALKNDGVLVAYKAGGVNMDTFWGSKNWLDSTDKPKPEHMYDETELSINKEERFEI
jgi:hypothetical protein